MSADVVKNGDGYDVRTWVTHQPSGVVVLKGHPQLGGRYCLTDGGDWPCAAVREAALPDGVCDLDERLRSYDLAVDAIGLFLEYRDKHGYEERVARVAAIAEVIEGVTEYARARRHRRAAGGCR